jgi:hypothetical protein
MVTGIRTPRFLLALAAPLLLASGALAQAAAPAALGPSEAHRVAAAAFDTFASQWMSRMHRVEDDNRRKPERSANSVRYRGYSDDFRVELRATGYPGAPFVGLIRYGEHLYTCSDAGATRCNVAHTTPVTEIFRFQNGRWVY